MIKIDDGNTAFVKVDCVDADAEKCLVVINDVGEHRPSKFYIPPEDVIETPEQSSPPHS